MSLHYEYEFFYRNIKYHWKKDMLLPLSTEHHCCLRTAQLQSVKFPPNLKMVNVAFFSADYALLGCIVVKTAHLWDYAQNDGLWCTDPKSSGCALAHMNKLFLNEQLSHVPLLIT